MIFLKQRLRDGTLRKRSLTNIGLRILQKNDCFFATAPCK